MSRHGLFTSVRGRGTPLPVEYECERTPEPIWLLRRRQKHLLYVHFVNLAMQYGDNVNFICGLTLEPI